MPDAPHFCPYCGNELRPGARFCNRCGNAVPTLSPAAAPPPTPAQQPPTPPAPEPRMAPPPAPTPQPQMPLPAEPAPTLAGVAPQKRISAPVGKPAPVADPSRRRQMLIAGGIVVAMSLLLLCALGFAGYWYYLRPTGTPTITNTGTPPTPTNTGTITPATPTHTGTVTPATPTGSGTPPATAGPTSTVTPTTAPAAAVNFDGVSFSYHPSLAAGVSTEKAAAQTDLNLPVFDLQPEHVVLTLRGYPFVPDDDPLPQVEVFPVDAYSNLSRDAAQEINNLRDFLSRKPTDLANPNDTIPLLPLQNAKQVFQACIGYLAFKNGNGVRYVTQYNQGPAVPISNSGIFYTFQGLTQDGRYYISVRFPISNGILPDPNTVEVNQAFASNFNNYAREKETEMTAQPVTSFTPDLSLLDALVQTIQVQ
jgi:hypothetical protein